MDSFISNTWVKFILHDSSLLLYKDSLHFENIFSPQMWVIFAIRYVLCEAELFNLFSLIEEIKWIFEFPPWSKICYKAKTELKIDVWLECILLRVLVADAILHTSSIIGTCIYIFFNLYFIFFLIYFYHYSFYGTELYFNTFCLIKIVQKKNKPQVWFYNYCIYYYSKADKRSKGVRYFFKRKIINIFYC